MDQKIKTDSNSHQRMKQGNRSQVLTLLRREPLLSRVDLAEKTGLTKQTLSNIIQELLVQGVVVEVSTREADRAGRRPIQLRLRGEKLLSAGIQVTRNYVRGVVINHDALLLYESQMMLDNEKMDSIDCGSYVVSQIRDMLCCLLQELPGEGHFLGVGIGLQGIVDGRGGVVKYSRNLKLFDYPLKDRLRSEFPFPVCVDNQVRAFAAGEVWLHKSRALNHVLYVYVDQAVGGAVLIDGKLYTGSDWQAAKFGHTKVVRGGNLCTCGKKGCLQAHISIPVMLSQFGHRYSTFDELLRDTDRESVQQLLAEAGGHLGFALGNAINLLNPDYVIIGGELTKAGQRFESAMFDEMKETVSIPNDSTPVYLTRSSHHNGSTGAAALVFSQWFNDPVQMSVHEIKAWAHAANAR